MAMISISAASRIVENCSLLSTRFWVRYSKIVVRMHCQNSSWQDVLKYNLLKFQSVLTY